MKRYLVSLLLLLFCGCSEQDNGASGAASGDTTEEENRPSKFVYFTIDSSQIRPALTLVGIVGCDNVLLRPMFIAYNPNSNTSRVDPFALYEGEYTENGKCQITMYAFYIENLMKPEVYRFEFTVTDTDQTILINL